MFIVQPQPRPKKVRGKTVGGVGFGQWIKSHLVYLFIGKNQELYEGTENETSLSNEMSLFQQALLMTYPCDGYDITTHTITDFNGNVLPYDGTQSFTRLILTTFFGLPNRPMFYLPDDPDFHSERPELKLYIGHILFNFIGGWDFSDKISDEKAGWQYFAIIVKVLIILPIKFFTLPLKILLNIAKIFTELLPTYASYLCAYAYRTVFYERFETKNIHINRLEQFAMGVLSFLHMLTKIISLVGRAITSPEKAAKLAVAYAHEVRGKLFGLQVGTILGFITGVFSVAVSAAFWAVVLPLTLAAALSYFPTVMNVVIETLTWISTLPVIAPTLSILNGITTATVTALSAAFSPIVLPLSALIGVQVSAAVLSIGTGLGILLLPIATLLSRVADYYSDKWICWHTSGPLTRWFSQNNDSDPSLFKKKEMEEADAELLEISRTPKKKLADEKSSASKQATSATRFAESAYRTSTQDSDTPSRRTTDRPPMEPKDLTDDFNKEFKL